MNSKFLLSIHELGYLVFISNFIIDSHQCWLMVELFFKFYLWKKIRQIFVKLLTNWLCHEDVGWITNFEGNESSRLEKLCKIVV